VKVCSPNSAVQRYEYDAKGRQVLSWTEVGGTWAESNGEWGLTGDKVVVSRTQTVYDYNDRAIQTIHWERGQGATSGEPDEVAECREADKGSPISPRVSREKNVLGRFSACRADRLNSPHRSSLSVVRIPVFVQLVVMPRGHAPVTHQDQG